MAAPPDLEHGIVPLSPLAPAQLPFLGRGVAPLGYASAWSVAASVLLRGHMIY